MRRTVNINDILHQTIQKTRAHWLLNFDVDFSYNDIINLALNLYFTETNMYDILNINEDDLGLDFLEDENTFKQILTEIEKGVDSVFFKDYVKKMKK